MPDITMCSDDKCHQFKDCYRAQANPNPYYQAYFVGSPAGMDGCKYYTPLFTEEELYADRFGHRNKLNSRPDTLGSDEGH